MPVRLLHNFTYLGAILTSGRSEIRHITCTGIVEKQKLQIEESVTFRYKEAIIMFNLKSKIMLAAAVLFIGGVSAANAQVSNGSIIKVSVPSEFVVRDATLPAGEYTIERTPNIADSPSLLILRGEGEAIVFDTMVKSSTSVADTTELVFDTVAGVNYLSAILVRGESGSNQVPKTKAQRKQIESAADGRQVVTITDAGL